MRHYEVMVILDPTLDERTVAPTLDNFLNVIRTSGGNVENVEVWGKRRLSFEIKKHTEGIYAVLDVNSEPDAVKELDRQLGLQETVLRPLLGIGDVRTDKRIDFVGGARGTAALEALVTSGEAAVAFAMHPVSVDDLMTIADAGGIMPPKSTWFEPKLRDGLLVHLI